MSGSSDQSSVPVEHTAVPAGPLWPCVIEGMCTWCEGPESEHDRGVREHHRIEVVGGRYDDEPEILRPGLPALVDPARTVRRALLVGEGTAVSPDELGECGYDTAEC